MENVTTPFVKRMEYVKKFLIFGTVCVVNWRLVGNTLSTPSLKASRTVATDVSIQLKLLYTMYIDLRRKTDFVRPYSSAFKN